MVLAERDDRPVGYALCHLRTGPDDTWDTGDVLGEVETLVLSAEVRGERCGHGPHGRRGGRARTPWRR